MSLLSDAAKGIRMAGKGLVNYATNPNTLSEIGQKVALETALGTAVSQAVPAMLGAPRPGIRRTMGHMALNAALSNPISGGLSAMGAPKWAAQTTGSMLGAAGTQLLTTPITPELQKRPNPELAQYMELQKFNAALEQQRYNNSINLAYARNYNPPSTSTIVHKNPSADLDTAYRILNPNIRY